MGFRLDKASLPDTVGNNGEASGHRYQSVYRLGSRKLRESGSMICTIVKLTYIKRS